MVVEESNKPNFYAIVDGKELTQAPNDLFIPPDALEILLESFSGPLDLLLYLIRKQNIDILNIPIVSITQQYLLYIHLMEHHTLELAADYLLMAVMLAEIKAKLLLPSKPNSEEEEDEDPRMTLVRRLQAYEEIKAGSLLIDGLLQQERDTFSIQVVPSELAAIKVFPNVALIDLTHAMESLLQQAHHHIHHQISREVMSVHERMNYVLIKVQQNNKVKFVQLFTIDEGRMGLVVTLLAILELARQSLIVLSQDGACSPIYLWAA